MSPTSTPVPSFCARTTPPDDTPDGCDRRPAESPLRGSSPGLGHSLDRDRVVVEAVAETTTLINELRRLMREQCALRDEGTLPRSGRLKVPRPAGRGQSNGSVRLRFEPLTRIAFESVARHPPARRSPARSCCRSRRTAWQGQRRPHRMRYGIDPSLTSITRGGPRSSPLAPATNRG